MNWACLILKTARYFLIFLAIPFVTYASEDAKQPACLLVKPPTTPVELLNNIKCAVSSNLLFEDELLTNDEKLWELFGGQDFSRFYPYPENYNSVYVRLFRDSIDENMKHKMTWPSDRLGIALSKDNQAARLNGKSQVELRINNGSGLKLSFDDVLKILGPEWHKIQEMKFYSPASFVSFKNNKKAKHSYTGPDVIGYNLPSIALAKAGAIIHFNDDGLLNEIVITLVE